MQLGITVVSRHNFLFLPAPAVSRIATTWPTAPTTTSWNRSKPSTFRSQKHTRYVRFKVEVHAFTYHGKLVTQLFHSGHPPQEAAQPPLGSRRPPRQGSALRTGHELGHLHRDGRPLLARGRRPMRRRRQGGKCQTRLSKR